MTENNLDFLTDEEKVFLLKLARETITLYLTEGQLPAVSPGHPRLTKKQGAFVTLKVNGQLRGCIGYPLPYKPLYQTIQEAVIFGGGGDSHFLNCLIERFIRQGITKAAPQLAIDL